MRRNGYKTSANANGAGLSPGTVLHQALLRTKSAAVADDAAAEAPCSPTPAVGALVVPGAAAIVMAMTILAAVISRVTMVIRAIMDLLGEAFASSGISKRHVHRNRRSLRRHRQRQPYRWRVLHRRSVLTSSWGAPSIAFHASFALETKDR